MHDKQNVIARVALLNQEIVFLEFVKLAGFFQGLGELNIIDTNVREPLARPDRKPQIGDSALSISRAT